MLKNTMINSPKCPSCGDKKMVTDQNTGELFCSNCGLVVTDKITDTGAEWRSFSNDEGNKARTGAGTSLTMHDMGLSTVIGAANKDATGKPLSASVKSSIERLRKC
jgi:transcription initiation factor TFIIB